MARHVESLEVVTADGQVLNLANDVRPDPSDRIASGCLELLTRNAELIRQATNRPSRARLGYQLRGACHDGLIDMARLVTGSEGTLAVITRATIKTVPIPRAKGILQAAFNSLDQMAQAVPIAVAAGASACELMDRHLIQMATEAFDRYRQILPAGAAAALLIELTDDNERQLTDRLADLEVSLRPLAYKTNTVLDPGLQAMYWRSRTDAVPLLYRRPGQEKPVPIIEDTTVDPRLLGRYIQGLERISQEFQTQFCYYGHAGDGELHIRPYLDLGRPEDVQKMKDIAQQVFSLVWSLGGSISGEHAYGLLRAGYLRQEFGPAYVDLLRHIKRLFDPQEILNPGKLFSDQIDLASSRIRRSAHLIASRLSDLGTRTQACILECNGCGTCRLIGQELRMCPVYKAIQSEAASPRAKANLIEAWAAGILQEAQLYDPVVGQILDLCIHCKACSRQCPSGLDVSRLVQQAKALRIRQLGIAWPERVLVNNSPMCRAARLFAPLANPILRSRAGRWLLEALLGLDRSVLMPAFERGSFTSKARRFLARLGPPQGIAEKVVYLPDAYVCLYDHRLGLDVLKVLHANGLQVSVQTELPVPAPAIYYGAMDQAKAGLRRLVVQLWPLVETGSKVVVSEPTAALVLREELPILIDDPKARAVADNTWELMAFLDDLMARGRFRPPDLPITGQYAYHLPCHGMAIWDRPPAPGLLKAAGLQGIEQLDAGCCGLAGTYGMQARHRQVSNAIGSVLKARLGQLSSIQVITECSACRIQIRNLSSSSQPIHPIQLVALAYAKPPKR